MQYGNATVSGVDDKQKPKTNSHCLLTVNRELAEIWCR